jgi:hypothetical protein
MESGRTGRMMAWIGRMPNAAAKMAAASQMAQISTILA